MTTESGVKQQLTRMYWECPYMQQKVGVIYGGVSAEREISLLTGSALAGALRNAGYTRVEEYDLPNDLARLAASPPAVAVLGMHGAGGEGGSLQGFLEQLEVPYTGSGVLASALAMDKARAKAVMASFGVPVAPGFWLAPHELDRESFVSHLMGADWAEQGMVLKPNDGGSSCGVYFLEPGQDPGAVLDELKQLVAQGLAQSVLVERMIRGPEFSVGFFDEVCLGAMRIQPAQGFYDFHAKYETNTTQYHRVDGALLARLERVAKLAWRALGCRGVGRIDVMGQGGAEGTQELFVLEANTIPGMTATSLVPKMAGYHGIDFEAFTSLMATAARTDVCLPWEQK